MLSKSERHFERQLGETEVSYFLPSREDGVNDMYLLLGFHAPEDIVQHSRISLVWAILRLKHPLLAAAVKMQDYNDIQFVYECPSSPDDAVARANSNLEYRSMSKDELLESYLNGPRTLSSERLSYLIVSHSPTPELHVLNGTSENSSPVEDSDSDHSSTSAMKNYDLMICTTHFLGDGMALHNFSNDFFHILGNNTEEDLKGLLEKEWEIHCTGDVDLQRGLPPALEDRLPRSGGRFKAAVSQVDFQRSQEKLIGGHSFPKVSGKSRHTIVPTVPFGEERTKKILKNCKAHGVSISSALFAICNIAWSKTTGANWELPIMMYSALNLRPYLSIDRPLSDSYWFIAIGYFNVVLPAFLPKDKQDVARTFWLRALEAKNQSTQAAKSRMILPRSLLMAKERGARARVWAKEDDDKANGVWKPTPKPASAVPEKPKPKAPSAALMGLSLLGNLDGIYKHASFTDIKLHTLTTGSRQRSGGMLLFGYTFVGKLWVSLGYDENGFETETVEKFWDNVLKSIDEFL